MIIDAVNKIDASINVGRTEGMKQLRRTGIMMKSLLKMSSCSCIPRKAGKLRKYKLPSVYGLLCEGSPHF